MPPTRCSSCRRRPERASCRPRRASSRRRQHLIFACGRYEGIDQRVVDHYAERIRVELVSLGDYVLNGGEVAVMAMVEAVGRLIPGVVGNPESLVEESHEGALLEYPSYTKPVGLARPRRAAGAAERQPRRDRALAARAARRAHAAGAPRSAPAGLTRCPQTGASRLTDAASGIIHQRETRRCRPRNTL